MSQGRDRDQGQVDVTHRAALWLDPAAGAALELLAHMDDPGVEVDVAPHETADLALAQTGGDRGRDERLVARPAERGQELFDLSGRGRIDAPWRGSRAVDELANVVPDDAQLASPAQRDPEHGVGVAAGGIGRDPVEHPHDVGGRQSIKQPIADRRRNVQPDGRPVALCGPWRDPGGSIHTAAHSSSQSRTVTRRSGRVPAGTLSTSSRRRTATDAFDSPFRPLTVIRPRPGSATRPSHRP